VLTLAFFSDFAPFLRKKTRDVIDPAKNSRLCDVAMAATIIDFHRSFEHYFDFLWQLL